MMQFIHSLFGNSEEQRTAKINASGAQRALIVANCELEEMLKKDPDLLAKLAETKRLKDRADSVEHFTVAAANSHKYGLAGYTSALFFGAQAYFTSSPTCAGIAAVSILLGEFFRRRSFAKLEKAEEVAGREYLGDVNIDPEAVEDFINELNGIQLAEDVKIDASPLEREPNHIWIAADHGYRSHRIASLYASKGLVSDFWYVTDFPKVTPVEEIPSAILKGITDLDGSQTMIECPFACGAIVRENDPLYYEGARKVHEIALKYAV
ncbi:hypothetical protein KY337_03970 [Candidatus Woesearchaeota archaeon]|nr:hypothetical protein [Candidatus Woesearchaeota archaeon]